MWGLKGPFIKYTTHLGGGRGLAILLPLVTEGGGGLAALLCNAKVYVRLT